VFALAPAFALGFTGPVIARDHLQSTRRRPALGAGAMMPRAL
jgi:hypothetical protein